jgi:hypothetical protein
MKTTASRLALAALLVAVAGFSHAQKGGGKGALEDCREDNRNALKPVEAQYASAKAKLPKADQDRYKSMLAAIKTGGSSLSDCRAKTPKIAELKQTLANMIAVASAPPPAKIGDKARGGIVFHVTDGGKHGLVAEASDVPVMGGVMIFAAAVQACSQSTAGGQSDWYLPNSQELYKLYEQKNVVGGFKTSGRDHYWNSSRMTGQDHKLYWQQFGNGQTGWADTEDNGPSRPLFNARCIRKF